jgi:hypothetical protein
MKNVFEHQVIFPLAMISLPIMTISYFFFSYFFNQGQSLGLSRTKMRIDMPYMNSSVSLKWALYSSAILLSGGIALKVPKIRNQFKGHDYLYHELLTEKVLYPINLSDHLAKQDETVIEEFYIAA